MHVFSVRAGRCQFLYLLYTCRLRDYWNAQRRVRAWSLALTRLQGGRRAYQCFSVSVPKRARPCWRGWRAALMPVCESTNTATYSLDPLRYGRHAITGRPLLFGRTLSFVSHLFSIAKP